MASAFQRLIHLPMLFLLPLCAGALWSLAARLLHRDLPWAALAMPLVLLLLRGQLNFLPPRLRIPLHACAAVIGIAYAHVLTTGARVAAQFGYEPMETLQTMGAAMTWELICLRSSATDILAVGAAIALAMSLGVDARQPPQTITPRSGP